MICPPLTYSTVKAESVSSGIGNKTRMPILTTFIQYGTGSSSRAIRQEKVGIQFKKNYKCLCLQMT